MTNVKTLRRAMMAGVLIAGLVMTTTVATPASAQSNRNQGQTTASDLLLSVGRGRLITLPTPMNDVFVANQEVADVQVRSSTQLYIFGKAPGETSIYATDAAGRVVYSVVARVGNNIETIDQMLLLAMPAGELASLTSPTNTVPVMVAEPPTAKIVGRFTMPVTPAAA